MAEAKVLIPDTAVFNEFLSKLNVHFASDQCGPNCLYRLIHGGSEEHALHLSYPREAMLSWDAFARKLEAALWSRKHLAFTEITNAVSALFALRPHVGEKSPAQQLNDFLNTFKVLELKQWYVLPGQCPDEVSPFKFGDFAVGPLAAKKLNYSTTKAKCAFPEGIQFSGREFALERERFSLIGLGIKNWVMTGPEEAIAWNAYFGYLSSAYFRYFFWDLDRQQEALLPFGGTEMSSEVLSMIPESSAISLFSGVGDQSKGWLSLDVHALAIDLGNMHIGFTQALLNISTEGLDVKTLVKNDPVLQRALQFFRTAKRHRAQGKPSDSLLHYVIVLEALFGSKVQIEKTIARRAAAISRHFRGDNFEDTVKYFVDIYRERSEFVHAGESANGEVLAKLEDSVGECLRAALRAANRGISIAHWRKILDHVASTEALGKKVDDKDLLDAGIRSVSA